MTPDKYTNRELMLDVGDGHTLYVHDWGHDDANVPILFLHGGPGSGVSDKHKRRFEPENQRVVFFDQRGAGKSLPKGELRDNTTDKLIEDIEKILSKLQIKKIILVGGSWGSTLALTYAIRYPERVKNLVVSGIFTARSEEIDYIDNGGFRAFFPEVWNRYVASVPRQNQANPSKYHYEHALGKNKNFAKKSAYAYMQLEGPLVSIDDRYYPDSFDDFEPEGMIIEMHYLHNNCFLEENYILNNAAKLTMPVWIIQGRYDMVCPPMTAYDLHGKLPNSQLIWTIAGHGNDRSNYDVLRSVLLNIAP